MTPSKGIREAVLIAREAGVPLRIAAKMREPLERQYFDGCVRPLLGGDIEYLGELNAAEKYELLGGAFALLNPIQWPEPFGLVMIEALACGTPVVATRADRRRRSLPTGTQGLSALRVICARQGVASGARAGPQAVPRKGSHLLQHESDGRRSSPAL